MGMMREVFGASFLIAGVAMIVLGTFTRQGIQFATLAVIGIGSIWLGYKILHGPKGGGS